MPDAIESDTSSFKDAVTPLLRLVSHLTGFETAFITEIDFAAGQQKIVLAENNGHLQLPTGVKVDWSDSMCQLMFSQQLTSTDRLSLLFPESKGVQLGMQSFAVLPIKVGENTIGTLCGADALPKQLTASQLISLQYIAEALSSQLKALIDTKQHRQHAEQAHLKVSKLQSKVQDMAALANTDPLTELLNRRGFQRKFDEAASLCNRSGIKMTIMMMDIDNFKQFNDEHGHEKGDGIIRMVADGLREVARTTDIICRLGGDEFVLAAIDTDVTGARVLAERLTNYMQQQSEQEELDCTLSIGIASSQHDTMEQLLKLADKAMYKSKAAGRNTISVAASL